MNIIVCVKQVFDIEDVGLDKYGRVIIKDRAHGKINIYDTYALEQALLLKDKDVEVKIYALSIGDSYSEAILRECFSVGVDDVFLLNNEEIGPMDTLSTAFLLAKAIEKISETIGHIDLVFCGKQSSDSATAQVGPQIAEILELEQITNVLEVISYTPDKLKIMREIDDGHELVESSMPCLLTFTKSTFNLRYPVIKNKLKSMKKEVNRITIKESGACDGIGMLFAEPRIKINETHVNIKDKKGQIFQEEDVDLAIDKLLDALNKAGIL